MDMVFAFRRLQEEELLKGRDDPPVHMTIINQYNICVDFLDHIRCRRGYIPYSIYLVGVRTTAWIDLFSAPWYYCGTARRATPRWL